MVAYSSLMPGCAAHRPRPSPKENPGAGDDAGAREQATADGRIVSGRLRDWNSNAAPCLLISTFCCQRSVSCFTSEGFLSSSLRTGRYTGRYTVCGRRRRPRASSAAAVGSGACASGPCSAQDQGGESSSTKCRICLAVIKLQSNRTMVVFRGVVEPSRNATWSSYHHGTPLLGA